jgi:hypothetical protein
MDLGQRFPDRQVGSNSEPFTAQLVRFGEPIDLSTASVSFSAIDDAGVAKVSSAAGNGSADGVASYQPTLADLDTPGLYACQFVAVFSDSTVYRSEVISLQVLPNP